MHRTSVGPMGLALSTGLMAEAAVDGGDPGEGAGAATQETAAPPADDQPSSFTIDQVRGMKPIDLITDEQLKSDPTLGNISDLDTMARMLHSAQKMVGNPKNYIRRLQEGASDEERAAFYRDLGAPETPDDYTLPADLERPEGMPEMSEERLAEFRQVFHRAGLTTQQSAEILKAYSNLEASVWQGHMESSEQAAHAAEQALRQDWGQAYDEQLQLAQAVADKKGDDFKSWLESKGLDNDPHMIRMLAELGGNMQDPALPKGGSAGSGQMTRAAALEKIAELKGNTQFVEAWTTASHPGHQQAQAQMTRLFQIAHPPSEARR